MTLSHLREDYETCNRLYFGNKLPKLPIKWGDLPGTVVGRTRYQRPHGTRRRWTPVEIVIDRVIRRPYLASTTQSILLHEMAHVKLGVGIDCEVKGGAFDKEMLRLAMMGAFQGLW